MGDCVEKVLGLIAGNGVFPIEIAAAATRGGFAVHAVGFQGLTRPDLSKSVAGLTWHQLGEVEPILRALREAGVRSLVMAGKIDKIHLTGPHSGTFRADERASAVLERLESRTDRAVMQAVADLLEREGFLVQPQSEYTPELVPTAGLFGGGEPSVQQRRDLAFGWPIARKMADAGIGQCIVVKDGSVVAIEAAEGTDSTIRRALDLTCGGVTVIKLAARDHDPRFDMPAVGPDTIRPLLVGAPSLLAIEAGKTLVLERAEMREIADAQQTSLLSVGQADEVSWNLAEGSI